MFELKFIFKSNSRLIKKEIILIEKNTALLFANSIINN